MLSQINSYIWNTDDNGARWEFGKTCPPNEKGLG